MQPSPLGECGPDPFYIARLDVLPALPATFPPAPVPVGAMSRPGSAVAVHTSAPLTLCLETPWQSFDLGQRTAIFCRSRHGRQHPGVKLGVVQTYLTA